MRKLRRGQTSLSLQFCRFLIALDPIKRKFDAYKDAISLVLPKLS